MKVRLVIISSIFEYSGYLLFYVHDIFVLIVFYKTPYQSYQKAKIARRPHENWICLGKIVKKPSYLILPSSLMVISGAARIKPSGHPGRENIKNMLRHRMSGDRIVFVEVNA